MASSGIKQSKLQRAGPSRTWITDINKNIYTQSQKAPMFFFVFNIWNTYVIYKKITPICYSSKGFIYNETIPKNTPVLS